MYYSVNGWVDSTKTSMYKILNTYLPTGLVSQNVQSLINGTNAHINTYGYDSIGRRTHHRIGHPTDSAQADRVGYRYNNAGQLAAISVTWRNSFRRDSVLFQWDALGRRDQLHYAVLGGYPVDVNYSYDAAGRQRRICSGYDGAIVTDPVFRFRVAVTGIEPDGLITQRNMSPDSADCPGALHYAGPGQTNTYDNLHQLIKQTASTDDFLYEYDDSGNMLRKGMIGVDTTWTNAIINSTSNRLQWWHLDSPLAAPRYEYHPDGSRKVERHRNFSTGSPIDNLDNRLYFYDALGRMTGYQKYMCTNINCVAYEPGPTKATACHYGPDGAVWVSCSANIGRRLGYDGANIVRTDPGASNGWTFVHAPGVDEPLLGTKVSTPFQYYYFWITDGNGRLIVVGDSAGTNRSQSELGSQLKEGEDPGAIAASWGFAASRDPNPDMPNLSFFRNRFYDQNTGRWTQEDPLGLAGGINLYSYSGNNPVSYTDPFGLNPCLVPPAAAVCVAGAVVIGLAVTASAYEQGGKDAVVQLAQETVAHARAIGTRVRQGLRKLGMTILVGAGLHPGVDTSVPGTRGDAADPPAVEAPVVNPPAGSDTAQHNDPRSGTVH